MARRFATGFAHAQTSTSLSQGWLTANTLLAGAGGSITWSNGDTGRLYVAPNAYSAVRKVIFWACIRHEYTGTEVAVPVRLRVFPTSTSPSSRIIDSEEFGSSTMKDTSAFAGAVWPVTSPTPTNEAVFYPADAVRQNTFTTIRFNNFNTQGSQLLWQEFDRFEGDPGFFNDWDLIDALGNDAQHIAYHLAVQRTDATPWLTTGATSQRAPIIVACGFVVVQAPSPSNKTRVYVPCTGAMGIGAISTAAFASQNAWPSPFFFHADEWSGDFEIRVVQRQGPSGSQSGFFQSRVVALTNQSDTVTELFQENFGVAGSNGRLWFARSQEFSSLLTDGMAINLQNRSLTAGNQTPPWGWFEITLRDFNIMTTILPTGHGPFNNTVMVGGTPPPDKFHQSSSLFDPLWFEDLEASRFISSRIQGGIRHLAAANATDQQLSHNASLGADVSVSAFNAIMDPEVSSTPNATLGMKLLDQEITNNDPMLLAGKRKLTVRYGGTQWNSAPGELPGHMQLAYVLNIPNTDVVPLGPLFDVGSFDAEGCAATSAGLGEPGVLVITNGSTIPKKFNPQAAGTTSEIEDAGIPVPFEGETPTPTVFDASASPDGGLNIGTYRYRYTFRNCCTGKESDPNPDDIVVDTSTASPAARVVLSFAGVRIPADPQICEICLYRTVEGGDFPAMTKVGCFNVDDTSIFEDDLSDEALLLLPATDGLSILNAPMPCVAVVVDFRNRLFGLGDIPNLAPAGTVSVTNGSDIILGSDDVQWDRCMEGKFIYVGADCRSYEILRILPPEVGTSPAISRLKLTEDYKGENATGLDYHICGRPNRLYFSEPLEPEYWPVSGFIDVEPGDGDRLMGAVSNYDRLVICKRRKTYVMTFRELPGLEVIVPARISSDIGCIGPRTFAQAEVGSIWLADRGLAIFDGRSVAHVPESAAMNDIFTDEENPNYVRRDRNGRVIEAVAVFYPKREQYLLLLPTVQTTRGCNMMLVWDVKLRNITLLKFCQEFLSMVVAKDSNGNERVYLGDTNGFVWIYDIGDTDGVGFPNATGTVRGDVTFAGIDAESGASVLVSEGASFIEGGIPIFASLSGVAGLSPSWDGSHVGLAGVCVYTRLKGAAYDDPWLQRTIYAATTDTLYVTPQWGPDTPFDATGEFQYEFMIGPIQLDLLFKPQNYGVDDMQKRSWRQYVIHEVEQFASELRIDLLPDFQFIDSEADTVVGDDGQTGQGRIFRMDYSKGRQEHPVGRLIHDFMAVRMRNFAPEEPIRIINHLLGEDTQKGK